MSPPAILGDRHAPPVLHQTAQTPKPGGRASPGFNCFLTHRPEIWAAWRWVPAYLAAAALEKAVAVR